MPVPGAELGNDGIPGGGDGSDGAGVAIGAAGADSIGALADGNGCSGCSVDGGSDGEVAVGISLMLGSVSGAAELDGLKIVVSDSLTTTSVDAAGVAIASGSIVSALARPGA
jgi:hypothetical protein